MICAQCNEPIIDESKMIMVTADGDFVCDDDCRRAWEKAKEHLFNDILPSESATESWLLGID